MADLRVLVVEDDASMRNLLTASLEADGYEVFAVVNQPGAVDE